MEREGLGLIRKLVDDFGRNEVMDVGYRELEPKGEFPSELVSKISQMGLMGISFPTEYGGMGMNTVATSVVGERLAFYWPSLQLIWSANVSLAGYPIMTFGTEEQKKRFLPRLATGEILGCYALTEPDAGSDAASIRTSARLDTQYEVKVLQPNETAYPTPPTGPVATAIFRREWRLTGTKTFITNANNASVGIIFARTTEERTAKRYEGITALILESREPGLKNSGIEVNKIDKWGLCSSRFCEIVLDGVVIPEENVLGGIGKGFHIAMETLNNGRINIAAQAVGIARRALHEAKQYAKGRKAFCRTLMEMDVRAVKLAELEARVDAAWQLVLEASRLKDAGEDYRYISAKAKLVATEFAVECALENYRIQGGFGYTKDSIAMPILHDALATITYEGTSDIQKLTIAKSFRE